MKISAIIKTGQAEQKIMLEGSIYKISLKNAPINNKANNELIKLIEKEFNKKVLKITGAKSNRKTIELE